jgi:hypothetical protein
MRRAGGPVAVFAAGALLAAALVAAGPAGARTDPPPTPAPQYDRPARPIVESLGHRLRAVQGTTCWSTVNTDGTGVNACGDASPQPTTRRRLRVRSSGVIRIDMGIPVNRLFASLPGSRPLPRLRRLDADGRHWRVRLPRRFRRTTVLTLGAYYTQGDAAFGVTLRHVRRAGG